MCPMLYCLVLFYIHQLCKYMQYMTTLASVSYNMCVCVCVEKCEVAGLTLNSCSHTLHDSCCTIMFAQAFYYMANMSTT